MAAASVLEGTDWNHRVAPFEDVRRFEDGRPIVVMELTPKEPQRRVEWEALMQRWLELLPHHHILDAIKTVDDTLLLRYAAIDWQRAPMRSDSEAGCRLIATWGRQLVDVYTMIASQFAGEEAHFIRPLIAFDMANRLRVGFSSACRVVSIKPTTLTSNDRRTCSRSTAASGTNSQTAALLISVSSLP